MARWGVANGGGARKRVGSVRCVEEQAVVRVPGRAKQLEPQQLTAPVYNNANVWKAPAVIETAVTPPVNAATATGAELLMVLLLPSCPKKLLPQQLTAPVFNNAHVW